MIVSPTGVAIKTSTISGKINNNKTGYYLVKVKHLKHVTIASKKVSKVSMQY